MERVMINGVVQMVERTWDDQVEFILKNSNGKTRRILLRGLLSRSIEREISAGSKVTVYGCETDKGILAKSIIIHSRATNFESVASPMSMYW